MITNTKKVFKLNIVVFLIAFIIGLVYVYVNVPKSKIIVKYPTPYNSDKLTYMGLSGECYKFKAEQVACTNDAFQQPIV
jgi:hypothetical protein